MESSSELVIKVNYRDVLRRFRVPVNANGQLDLDMARLREKITSLFNLPVDAELSLTYTDEDGDVVTLVDDNDLHDVVNQRLKFLRINVQLNTSFSANSSAAASSESSTPVGLPHSQDPFTKIHKGLNQILMAVPDPLRDTISKVSMDLASKAACTSPVVGEMLQSISKLGQVSRPQESPSSPVTQVVSRDGGLPSRSTTSGPTLGRKVPTTRIPVVDLNLDPPCDAKSPSSSEQKDVKAPSIHVSISSVPGASFNECPFSGNPLNSDSSPNLFNKLSRRTCHSKKRDNSDFWTSLGMFHKGVRCDGCGVLPITGPRFKSKVKEDYDLCSICFSQMGNERDYIRMDKPVAVQPLRKLRRPFTPVRNPWLSHPAPPPPLPQGGLHFGLAQPKLDSRFVLDVNVLDGTVVAPSTPFTKIWRLRNNGSLVWPCGTQLVWIGGDRFSNSVSVDLEIPEGGMAVDSEIDVAVDFVAPESPGRYISYWRMASSSGAKFGQRVWVLIHVDASMKDSVVSGFHGLNLNASPDEGSSKEFVRFEVYNESDELNGPGPRIAIPAVDVKPNVEESKAPEKDGLLDVPSSIPPRTHAPSSSSSCHIIDLTEPAAPVEASRGHSSTKDIPISLEKDKENNDVEQVLLKELEEMGFKEIDLNKEILRKNKYNLEQSVDALCGASDWDPILEELQEMGFGDNETNKRLLKKNNGSIKGVVMDYLTGEKA